MRTLSVFLFLAALSVASPCFCRAPSAASSPTPPAPRCTSAQVTLRAIATGEETRVDTDAQGRYRFDVPDAGSYLVIVTRAGFSDAARTVVVEDSSATPGRAGVARARRDERRGERDGEPLRARGAADPAARRDAFARRRGAEQPALDRRRPDHRGQRHAGRQRAVRRAAAPARARFDAPARARGRRAPEHRPAGHRSHRRRGRADLAPTPSAASRSSTAPAR